MSSLRSFLAVNLPDKVKDKITPFVQPLRYKFKNVRWVSPVNQHLTLKFYGNVEEEEINKLSDDIRKGVKGFGKFEISFGHFGYLGSKISPRVILIGVDKGKEELAELNNVIEEISEVYGFEREKREFFPHLTIGRCKKRTDGIVETLEKMDNSPVAFFEAEMLSFFSSDLTPDGPVYTKLYDAIL